GGRAAGGRGREGRGGGRGGGGAGGAKAAPARGGAGAGALRRGPRAAALGRGREPLLVGLHAAPPVAAPAPRLRGGDRLAARQSFRGPGATARALDRPPPRGPAGRVVGARGGRPPPPYVRTPPAPH